MSDRVMVICDRGHKSVIATFAWISDPIEPPQRWVWERLQVTGHSGRRDPVSGLYERYMPSKPSRWVVRDDYPDGIPRVRLFCKGHADARLTWDRMVSEFLDPRRGLGEVELPVRMITAALSSSA